MTLVEKTKLIEAVCDGSTAPPHGFDVSAEAVDVLDGYMAQATSARSQTVLSTNVEAFLNVVQTLAGQSSRSVIDVQVVDSMVRGMADLSDMASRGELAFDRLDFRAIESVAKYLSDFDFQVLRSEQRDSVTSLSVIPLIAQAANWLDVEVDDEIRKRSLIYAAENVFRSKRPSSDAKVAAACANALSTLIDALPEALARLYPSWEKRRPWNYPLSREIFDTIIARFRDDNSDFGKSALDRIFAAGNLSWMSDTDATTQINWGPCTVKRFIEFAAASDMQFRDMLARLFEGKEFNSHISGIESLPGFVQRVRDMQLVEPLIFSGILREGNDGVVMERMAIVRAIAEAQPTPAEGRRILHGALAVAARELKQQSGTGGRFFGSNHAACLLLKLCSQSVGPNALVMPGRYEPYKVMADTEFIRNELNAVGMARIFEAGGAHAAAVADETYWQAENGGRPDLDRYGKLTRADMDNFIQECLELTSASPDVQRELRSALIECGATSLGSLPEEVVTDGRFVGAALMKDPQRLAEITDFELFMRVARENRIAIDLPDGATESAAAAEGMRSAAKSAVLDATPDASMTSPARRRMSSLH